MIAGTVKPASRSSRILPMVSGHQPRLATKPDAPRFRLSDAVHLPLAPDIVLELGYQRQGAP
jgi:hypothetical protein